MTLGKRIKAARERLRPKVTQQNVAEALGVSDKAVSNWERDIDTPEMDKMPVLRRVLRVTYGWLHEGAGTPPSPDDPQVLLEDGLASIDQQVIKAGISAMLEALKKRNIA